MKIKESLTALKFNPLGIAARKIIKLLTDAYPSILLKLDYKKRDALVDELRQCSTVRECVEFTQRRMRSGSCQIIWEIESAIKVIDNACPQIVCEIGTFDGGTSLLFSKFFRSLEMLLCVDLYVKNKEMLRLLSQEGQHLHFIDMPSYSARAVNRVAKILDGRLIDALFIDGDHRYEGVKQDFICYRRFVKEGGLILFHDIVDDKGVGPSWSGGVPKLWKELSPHYVHQEIIFDREQQGFGIGILTYTRRCEGVDWKMLD